jgi:hypothetical protein
MKITHIVVWNALTKNQKPYIGVEILLKDLPIGLYRVHRVKDTNILSMQKIVPLIFKFVFSLGVGDGLGVIKETENLMTQIIYLISEMCTRNA